MENVKMLIEQYLEANDLRLGWVKINESKDGFVVVNYNPKKVNTLKIATAVRKHARLIQIVVTGNIKTAYFEWK